MIVGVMNGAAQARSSHENNQPVEIDATIFSGFVRVRCDYHIFCPGLIGQQAHDYRTYFQRDHKMHFETSLDNKL